MNGPTRDESGMDSLCTVSKAEDRVGICFWGPGILHSQVLVALMKAGYEASPEFFDDSDDDESLQYIWTTMPIPALMPLLSKFFKIVDDLTPKGWSFDQEFWGRQCLS